MLVHRVFSVQQNRFPTIVGSIKTGPELLDNTKAERIPYFLGALRFGIYFSFYTYFSFSSMGNRP